MSHTYMELYMMDGSIIRTSFRVLGVSGFEELMERNEVIQNFDKSIDIIVDDIAYYHEVDPLAKVRIVKL